MAIGTEGWVTPLRGGAGVEAAPQETLQSPWQMVGTWLCLLRLR